jgi:Ca2+/Na+ antiporter
MPFLINASVLIVYAVHYAGNLQIAASVFITLALLFSLILCLISLKPRRQQTADAPSEQSAETKTDAVVHHADAKRHKSKLTPKIVILLLGSLYIGAVLQIFAQFFGILGLTLNASPNAERANGDQPTFGLNNFSADDWTIDLALSRYATVAWTSALAAAAVATVIFRTPRSRKFF